MSLYPVMHPFNLFILVILFFIALEAYFHRNIAPLSEYKHSLLYKIVHYVANFKTISLFIFFLFMLFVFIFLTSYKGLYYPQYDLVLYDLCKFLIIPVLVLVFFDFLFLMIILPFIRTIIFNVHFYIEYISGETLFAHKRILHELIKTHRDAVEEYIFKMPRLDITDTERADIEYYLNKVARFIWTIRISSNNFKLKEYIYLVILVLIFLSFFLIFHSIYYKLIWQLNDKNVYILIFLIIWLIYVIMRLKTIVGSSYHYSQKTKEWESKDIPSILKEVIIYKFKKENGVIIEEEYTMGAIMADIKHSKDSKNLDNIIELSTTVLAAMVMQFIT